MSENDERTEEQPTGDAPAEEQKPSDQGDGAGEPPVEDPTAE